jgi:hypothetical protein
MQLDLILRGQSNAAYLAELDGGGAGRALTQNVEQLLGFDGVNDRVRLVYDRDGQGGDTAYPATAFLGEWMQKGPAGWAVGELEAQFLARIGQYRAEGMGDASAVVWLHSEYDSRDPNLSTADWTAAVRADAALVRGALGRDVPYLFVSGFPYGDGTDAGHQAIKLGMEQLAADPAFQATIAARVPDLDASLDDLDNNPATANFGGAHMNVFDARLVAARLARTVAEEWSEYAKPGSVVASAGGNIASAGPQVVAATRLDADTLQVDVRHDGTSGFLELNEVAARGIGWSLRLPDGQRIDATGAAMLDDDSLSVSFGQAVPDGAVLDYAWGIGRIAEFGGPGLGNAVMDPTYLAAWTPAAGVVVGAAAAPVVPQPAPTPVAPVVVEPAPPVVAPAPVVVEPPPSVVTPAPVVVDPPPPVVTPAPVVVEPPPPVAPTPQPVAIAPDLALAANLARLGFGRVGTEGEVRSLEGLLDAGVGSGDIARALADSPWFQDRTDGTFHNVFVQQVYDDALGRPPTHAEGSAWVDALRAGADREELVITLATSEEFAAVAQSRAASDLDWL